jgi:Fic family protein
MAELDAWFGQEGGRLHPLIAIGIFVVVFLAIHPFQDGNGRLNRVLTTLLLLRAGYAYVPYSSLDHARDHGRVTIADAVVLTGIP